MPTIIVRLAFIFMVCGLAACTTRPPDARRFSFAFIGDQQYTAYEERQFPDLLNAISREDLKFVVHVGDFKAGGYAPCTTALYERRLAEFNQSRHPFVYTPGDNDWVDCRRPSNGPFDPLERLDKLRDIFFARPQSIGRNRMAVTREADAFASDPILSRYRENMMWTEGEQHGAGVVFATVNIQGSNDNKGFDAANDREHAERTRANIAWLKLAMERASGKDFVGLAIFLQANPGFEEDPKAVQNSGHREFLQAFEAAAAQFGKPILFAHGDTHLFRIDRPYRSPLDKRSLDNVTRVECYGSPFVNWVRITVDGSNRAQPFIIESGNYVPSGN